MNIKFDSDDSLPLNKMVEIITMTNLLELLKIL